MKWAIIIILLAVRQLLPALLVLIYWPEEKKHL
jgi:hypothetical protein